MEYQYQIKPDILITEEEVRQMATELLTGVLSGLKNFVELEKTVPANH